MTYSDAIKAHKVRDHFTGNSDHVVYELNGLFIAGERDSHLSDLFQSLALNGAKLVRDWAGDGKRIRACRELLGMSGYSCELRFDAAHGRRYIMAAYGFGNPDNRRRAIAALHGMRNTNPEES